MKAISIKLKREWHRIDGYNELYFFLKIPSPIPNPERVRIAMVRKTKSGGTIPQRYRGT